MKIVYWLGIVVILYTLIFIGPPMFIPDKDGASSVQASTSEKVEFVKEDYSVDKFARMDGLTFYRVIDRTYDFGGGPELVYVITSNSSSKTVAISNPK